MTGLRRKAGRGRSTKRGPGEEILALKVVKLGLKHFHDDVIIHVDGHNYVPDLAFIDVERAIFIDIENDEPYTHRQQLPTHCKGGKDERRNALITSAGWTVIRFSEKQCFTQSAGCLRFVYDMVRQIAPEVEIPVALRNVEPATPEPRWDYRLASQYARQDYRNSYLMKNPLWAIYEKITKPLG